MTDVVRRKFLFVINKASGRKTPDWEGIISDYLMDFPFDLEFYHLPDKFTVATIKEVIGKHKPDQVIAVGGDGTVNLLSVCVRDSDISLGILPAGSANGMAKELGISSDVNEALKIIADGFTKKISLVEINDKISLHLSDLGLNAFMLREFERRGKRGLIGYLIATFKVLSKKRRLHATIQYNGNTAHVHADIIIIANATMFGTGVVVNPIGQLDDNVFEVIAIKNLTVKDLLKTSLHTLRLDEEKADIFQASEIKLHCTKPAHFQVDGEYLGKVQDVRAKLLPDCLSVIVPRPV